MEIAGRGVVFFGEVGSDRSNACFPGVCSVPGGRWMVCFRSAPKKTDSFPQKVLLTWSDDEGAKWADPVEPFSPPVLDGKPGIFRGGYLTPLGGERVLAVLYWVDASDYSLPFFNEETEGILPSRLFLALSDDEGRTWSEPWLLDTSPYDMETPITGPVLVLPDGEWALQFETNNSYYDSSVWRHSSVLMFSRDEGQSWPEHVRVTDDPDARIFYWDQRPGLLRASNRMPREPRCASGLMDARKGDDAVPGSGTARRPDTADAGPRRNPEGRGVFGCMPVSRSIGASGLRSRSCFGGVGSDPLCAVAHAPWPAAKSTPSRPRDILLEAPNDGTILDVFWTFDRKEAVYLNIHARHSKDNGRTWSKLWDLGIPGQPAAPVQVADGRIVMPYVDRERTPVIKLRTSSDGGRSWPDDTELILDDSADRPQQVGKSSMQDAWSEMAEFSVGLPQTALLPDGDVLVVYYRGPETDHTAVRWVRVRP